MTTVGNGIHSFNHDIKSEKSLNSQDKNEKITSENVNNSKPVTTTETGSDTTSNLVAVREGNAAPVDDRISSLFNIRRTQQGLPSGKFNNTNENVSNLDRIIHYGDEAKSNLNQYLTINNAGSELLRRMSMNGSIDESKLSELNSILNKFAVGACTNDDIKKLREFLTKGINDKSFEGIANQQDIEALNSLLVQLDNSNRKVEHARGDFYLRSIEDIKSSAVALRDILSSKPDNNFSKAITTLLNDYERVLANGNPAEIAIYKEMLNKLLTAAKEGASGQKLQQIMNEYSDVQKAIADKSPGAKDKIRNFLGQKVFNDLTVVLKDYYNNIKGNSSKDNPNERSADRKSQPNKGNNVAGDSKTPTVNKENKAETTNADNVTNDDPWMSFINDTKHSLPTYTPEFVNNFAKITDAEIKEVFSIPGINKVLDNYFEAGKRFDQRLNDLSKALTERENITKSVNKALNDVFKIEPDSQLFNDIKEMYQEINKLIELAEKIEDGLDLSVDGSSENMVNLLEKFREIINKCDTDMKKIIKQMLEKQNISESFTRNGLDMKQRWEKLDAVKEELMKVFNQATENKKTA